MTHLVALEESRTYNEPLLLSQAAAGSEAAFTALFHRHYPKVFQVGVLLTRSEELAEELVQDVFLKIWLQRAKLADIQDFESWLFIVARNQAYTYMRRLARKRALVTTGLPGETEPPSNETDDTILGNNYQALLDKAIRRLTPKQQEVYRLVKVEGLKREEAAERLQVQPETVKAHLADAVKSIRAYFVAHSDLLPQGVLFVLSLCWQASGK